MNIDSLHIDVDCKLTIGGKEPMWWRVEFLYWLACLLSVPMRITADASNWKRWPSDVPRVLLREDINRTAVTSHIRIFRHGVEVDAPVAVNLDEQWVDVLVSNRDGIETVQRWRDGITMGWRDDEVAQRVRREYLNGRWPTVMELAS